MQSLSPFLRPVHKMHLFDIDYPSGKKCKQTCTGNMTISRGDRIMYKVKNLKKLQKNELAEVEALKLQLTKKLMKAQLIAKFVETGICQTLPVTAVDVRRMYCGSSFNI